MGQARYLTVSALGFTTAAAIVTSLRGLPMMAQEELTMFFYIGFSTFLFLVPAGLIAAELGSAFGKREGGLYVWISAAFGKRTGFSVMFLSWLQVMVFFPTGLSFAAAAVAFTIDKPDLATNTAFVGIFCIAAFWLCTLVVLVSNRLAAQVTRAGFILGTAVPGLVLIGLFLWWALDGQPLGWSQATDPAVATTADGSAHPRFFPHIVALGGLAFLAGILLNFAGVESQAVHATELKNPRRGYPVAIMIAAVAAFGIFTLGALAVAGILSPGNINLNTGVFDALEDSLQALIGSTWPVYALALLIGYGALAGVLAWLAGPSRGILATAHDGMLPPWLQQVNRSGVQVNILITQGIVVTLLSSIYLFMDDVSVAFFLISAMAVSIYIIIYMFMYAAAIRLRYTQPDLPRAFKVPGGLPGMWAIAGGGFGAVAFAFVLSFVPPDQLPIGNALTYVVLVAGGAIVFSAAPLVISRFQKPSWAPPEELVARARGAGGAHAEPEAAAPVARDPVRHAG